MSKKKIISESDAVQIAEETIKGKVKRVMGSPIDVTYSKGIYTVTFVHHSLPGTLGADYDAQIKIDASTGEVLEFKVGP